MKRRSASKEKILMQKVIDEGGRLIIELQRSVADYSRVNSMTERYIEAIRELDHFRS